MMRKTIRIIGISFNILLFSSVAIFALQSSPAAGGSSIVKNAATGEKSLRFCPGSHLPCVEISPQQFARGRQQFTQSCAFCHGPDATGGAEGPDLLLSTVVRHDKSGEAIGKVIREGRPGKGMPPIPLNAQQIDDVVMFLHARVAEADRTNSGISGNGYQAKKLLTGNPAEGKAYFNGEGNCAKCHSSTGDLAGIAKKYSPMELESRFLYPPDITIMASISNPSGSVTQGKLLHLDPFYVAILNENGRYQSWPRNKVKVQVKNPLKEHLELLGKYKDKDIHNVLSYLETLK